MDPLIGSLSPRNDWFQVKRRIGHGCNCNRDTLAGITGAGFEVGDVERDRLKKAPPIVTPLSSVSQSAALRNSTLPLRSSHRFEDSAAAASIDGSDFEAARQVRRLRLCGDLSSGR